MKQTEHNFKAVGLGILGVIVIIAAIYLSKDIPVQTQKITKVIENSKFSK